MTTAIAELAIAPDLYLSFTRLVRSEWIKLRTVRSTFWIYGIVLASSLGLGAVVASALPDAATSGIPVERHAAFAFALAATGLFVGQLAIIVLGVLAISSEYATGMIRSSLAAAPARLSMLAAKALALFCCTFVVGVVSVGAGWAVVAPILAGKGFSVDLLPASVFAMSLYLALVAVFALGLGTALRSGAGGISAAFGVLFLLPTACSTLFALTQAAWIEQVMPYLLGSVGTRLINSDTSQFEPWLDLLIAAAWAAAAIISGALVLKRRDA